MPQQAILGPGLESNLGHQLRPDPMRAAPGRYRDRPEWRSILLQRTECIQHLLAGAHVPAGAEAPDIDQYAIPMDAQEQGAEVEAAVPDGRVAADDELLADVALDLEPVAFAPSDRVPWPAWR